MMYTHTHTHSVCMLRTVELESTLPCHINFLYLNCHHRWTTADDGFDLTEKTCECYRWKLHLLHRINVYKLCLFYHVLRVVVTCADIMNYESFSECCGKTPLMSAVRGQIRSVSGWNDISFFQSNFFISKFRWQTGQSVDQTQTFGPNYDAFK